jgi:branched-chain amino acid aminotransferase
MVEAFGSGTAVIVSPINALGYKDQHFDIPINPKLGAGQLASTLFNDFLNIQEGKVEHPWSRKI